MSTDGESRSKLTVTFAVAGATLLVAGCLYGMFKSAPRSPIEHPSPTPPEVTVTDGPSPWRWRPRTTETDRALRAASRGVSLSPTVASCAADDPLYARTGDGANGECSLRSQSLLALVSIPRFDGAPQRWDGTDFASLLPPSRAAGETASIDEPVRRQAVARVRAGSWVDQREASWCTFEVEGTGARASLRARCALDRLGLYIGRPPRIERTQSCGIERVEACREMCASDADCGEGSGCGCETSRCRAGRCTPCPARRVCGPPTFTTQAPPWDVRVPIGDRRDLVSSLVERPGAFRTILHFAVASASRDVRRRDDLIEHDSGYRLQIRPLALSVALCGDDCQSAFVRELPLFSATSWQGSVPGARLRCARGACTRSSSLETDSPGND